MRKSKTVDTIQDVLMQPGTTHTVFLTTFRRSGQAVGSPVGMAVADSKLYFMTPAATWKARRIANNPQVTLALCTFQGKVLSPTVAGVARRLSGECERLLVDSDHHLSRFDDRNHIVPLLEVQTLGRGTGDG
jgi:PPOX class probable F420-dependent enzyme